MSTYVKRYTVYAKHRGSDDWSVWTDTDDITKIEGYVARARELGYETKVSDPLIESYEKKRKKGHLLETPVAVGQTVYAIVEYDDEPHIEEWVVKALHYDGKVWYAVNDAEILYDVGSQWCIPSRDKAKKLLKELRGEIDDNT